MSFLVLLGRPDISSISAKQVQAMYHPQDFAKAFATLSQAIVEQVPVTLEYRLLLPNGSEINVLTHAEPLRGRDGRTAMVRGTTQDITCLRQIEAALRESEDHYRHMVELHPQIPWTAGPDGGVLEAGPKWHALTGLWVSASGELSALPSARSVYAICANLPPSHLYRLVGSRQAD
jgi:PAS domain-containing protein